MEATQYDSGTATGAEGPEIKRLKQELRQEHDMYLRALADFENYRKRIESERTSAAQRGMRDLILSLLEVVDNFELALQHIDDAPASLSEGLKAIYRSLQNLLERQGVIPIQSLGQKFDPSLHEAIDSIRSDGYEPGTVTEEVQRGYRWGEKLLRPARVRVAL
jgi:molecular chaperone GrpE